MLPALLQQPQREISDISRKGESRSQESGRRGRETGPSPGLSIFPFPSIPLLLHPAASSPNPPRRGDASHPSRSWGWAGAGCQSCWKQSEATHPPAHLGNQYLLELEGSNALLLEMEAHSPERPYQCAWQLQRLHQCGGVAQSLGLGRQGPRFRSWLCHFPDL